MIKTIVGIEGMMCGMCEAHINDAFRKTFQNIKIKASRKKRCAEIISEAELPEALVRKTVEDSGYTATSYAVQPYSKASLPLLCIFQKKR